MHYFIVIVIAIVIAIVVDVGAVVGRRWSSYSYLYSYSQHF